MDPLQYEQWLQDRSASDDEIDEILANHITQLVDEEDDLEQMLHILGRKHGGSRPDRSPNIFRDHAAGHERIWTDYFSPTATYPPHLFRRRFRMRRDLFMRIHDAVLSEDDYFLQRPDCVGNPGISSLQKMVAALRMLCYGSSGDAIDECVRIAESTAIASLKHFVEAVVNCFGDEYLRHPTEADVKKHMEINEKRGFPGMFGSLDCTHWDWKNCPVGEQGQFRDKDGHNSIVLEAISTGDLWIWHAFAGIPGSNNDINVLDRSPLLVNLLNGVAPDVSYTVNGHLYKMFYVLTDGIYPDYTIFVKTITDPQGAKRKWFAKRQEAIRKDVERCFGVLQARFHMVRHPARWWSRDQMQMIWKAAVILHNMVIEDEAEDPSLSNDYLFDRPEVQWHHRPRPPLNWSRLTRSVQTITDAQTANSLKEDLIEHLWQIRGEADDA